jgi:hypothetical protein
MSMKKVCVRCKKEIKPLDAQYMPSYGLVCSSCYEVICQDDDLVDTFTGRKVC